MLNKIYQYMEININVTETKKKNKIKNNTRKHLLWIDSSPHP